MSNFRVGEEVVCVKAGGNTCLKKGETYIVQDTGQCSCGKMIVFVYTDAPAHFRSRCTCGQKETSPYWYYSSRFRRKASQSAHEEVLEKFKIEEEKLDGKEKVVANFDLSNE